MPKELKPGWIYFTNDNLVGLEFAIHEETNWVYFEDGVKYSPEEIKILKESGGPPSKELHTVKKVFQGEIVRYDGKGTDDKNKFNESGGGQNTDNNTPPGGSVPQDTTTGAESKNGELDLF
jgi:hypothetical protein